MPVTKPAPGTALSAIHPNAASLVSAWLLQEGDGAWVDAVNPANTGATQGNPVTLVSGPNGGSAAHFAGNGALVGGAILCSNPPVLSAGFTIMIRFKPNTLTGDGTLYGTNSNNFKILGGGVSRWQNAHDSTAVFSAGSWWTVVYSRIGNTSTLVSIYADGVFDVSYTGTSPGFPSTVGGNAGIGGNTAAPSFQVFDGDIDYVLIFDPPLSPADIAAVTADPFALWRATPTLPDPGMDNSTPCCDDGGGPNAGPLLPPIDPAWTPVCEGGGELYDDATDPVDPESWDDPATRTADTWLELRLAKYPASEGTLVLRYAPRPFADEGAYKEGRLISLSRSRRACTDPDGNYELGRVSAVLADGDGYLRGLLDQEEATEYFANREAIIYTATEAARKAGNKRIRFRGWISGVRLLPARRIQIDIADVVGSQFSGFNLDKNIGIPITINEHPNAPPETLKLIYPIIGGERSDLGAVDENGDSAEKGVEPAIDCGDRDITGAEQAPGVVLPPINFAVNVVGTPGSKTQTYAITAITALGETLMCAPVTVTNAPDVRDGSNYLDLTWDPADVFSETNTIAYRVCGRSTNPPTTWLDGMNNGGTWVNPETAYHDDQDQDVEKGLPELGIGTGAADDYTFAFMLLAIGYAYDILDVFGSDVAEGDEPKRVKFDSAQFGTTIIRPQDPQWPHDDPYIEFGGIRQFGFYARGNPLKHHRNGSCTLAVTMCGPHGDADLVVNQLSQLDLWFLNEHAIKNNGTGYRTGDYGPTLETYANGDTILNKTKWDEAQDITIDWIGGLGYLADISIHEPMSLREFLRRRTVSFGWRYCSDHHGRIRPVVIDDVAFPTDGRLLRDRIEIKRNEDDVLAWDEVLNRIEFVYHYDADSGTYRAVNQDVENPDSIAAHVPGGVVGDDDRRGVKVQKRELWGVNDPATALDSMTREIFRRRRRLRYVKDTLDLMALDYEIGDRFRRTHYNGIGPAGDVETSMLALAFEEAYDRDEITIEMLDLRGIGDAGLISEDESSPELLTSEDDADVLIAG